MMPQASNGCCWQQMNENLKFLACVFDENHDKNADAIIIDLAFSR